MTCLLLDLRHAVRVLLRSPGVTFIAAFTLALAIGATTAVFSVVHGVLLRPLPYPSPHRLMAQWEVNNRGKYARLADPNFNDFRDRNRTFSAVAKYAAGVTSVGGEGEPTRETVAAVSRDFFAVLGVQPTLGRSFGPDDARIGAAPTVVVSHGYWVRSLGSPRSLSAPFAGTALVLAVAGVYGVISYNVTRRRREIGVRIALGATPGHVRRMILGQGLATTTVGAAVGVLGALGVTRTLESLLFGVTATDPQTFAVVIAGLCAVAALACYVPARRATLADPVEALRQE
jgi:hypothetical protein